MYIVYSILRESVRASVTKSAAVQFAIVLFHVFMRKANSSCQ